MHTTITAHSLFPDSRWHAALRALRCPALDIDNTYPAGFPFLYSEVRSATPCAQWPMRVSCMAHTPMEEAHAWPVYYAAPWHIGAIAIGIPALSCWIWALEPAFPGAVLVIWPRAFQWKFKCAAARAQRQVLAYSPCAPMRSCQLECN